MRVHWTDRAKKRLWKIHDYLAKEQGLPTEARNLVSRLLSSSQKLSEIPKVGRQVPEYQLREVRELLERPYRIVYVIKPYQIDVVTVMHYRQLLSKDLKDILNDSAF